MIHNAKCEKKSQMIKPEDLFNLPIDEERKKKRFEAKSTKQEMNDFLKKYEAMSKKEAFK